MTDFVSLLADAKERFRAHPLWARLDGTPWENDAPVIAAELARDAVRAANLANALWKDAEQEVSELIALLVEAYPIVCSFQCVAGDASVHHSALCRKITTLIAEPNGLQKTVGDA